MKAAGIGGFEINPIAMPAGSTETSTQPLSWLSPAWNRMVKVAATHARQQGMVPDLIVGSGWPFGGTFLDPEERIQGVALVTKTLTGPGTFSGTVEELTAAASRQARDQSPRRLIVLTLAPQEPARLEECQDLLARVKPEGTIQFEIPAGRHRLYAVVLRRDFKTVTWGAPGADGPILDHYNQAAVEKYLDNMSSALGPALGKNLGDGLRAMFCDSIELSGANWTGDLPQEFQKRCGYALLPYLPFILDRQAGKDDSPLSDTIRRARYDFSKTLVALFQERFIRTFHQWCHRNGVAGRYQAYGLPWLMGMLDGYMQSDIPEGDTWLFNGSFNGMDDIRYSVWNKYAVSAAHLTGRPLVSCESMTNTSRVFLATLEYIKQADDLNFVTGINHSVLHGFNYSPPEAGFPGWVRYGTYFSEKNSWWPYFRKWSDYHARISSVFQASQPVVEVAILGPTADVWSAAGLDREPFINTPWYLHQVWQTIQQNGYSADYVNEHVLQQATCRDGKLCFGPRAYEVLLVAEARTLEPATARVVENLAKAGGKIVFVESIPDRSPSLRQAQANDEAVRESMRNALAANPDRVARVTGPEEGKLLEWTGSVLKKFQVAPAVEIDTPHSRLFQIHHQLDGRDIFFFANLSRQEALSFGATFATGDKTPWRWDAESATRSVFPYQKEKRRLQVNLAPLESLLLVFEPNLSGVPRPAPAIRQDEHRPVAGPWQVVFQPAQGEEFERSLSRLVDFGQSQDKQLNTFAGSVLYRTEFDNPGYAHAVLDLGAVHDISEVTLNGKNLGVRWWGRHEYDTADALRPGKNVLEIKVTTVLSNYCRSLKEDPTARRWTGNRELVPAGLLGPVQLYRLEPAQAR